MATTELMLDYPMEYESVMLPVLSLMAVVAAFLSRYGFHEQ
jgi:hypothetical protein